MSKLVLDLARRELRTLDDSNEPAIVTLKVSDAGELSTSGGSFTPSSYPADLTMDGTAQGVALATGVTLGAGKVSITNLGATTEAIRFVFGISELDAEGNLNMTSDGSPEHATTGYYIPALVDSSGGAIVLQVPSLATHFAVANAVDSDTQTVSVIQGK